MAQGTLTTLLAFLCLYGFTSAQRYLDPPRILPDPDELGAFEFPKSDKIPKSDIQFDQEPPFAYSGDGKLFIDDEDYGVSGSGSGSGVGMYDPDVEAGDSLNQGSAKIEPTTTTTTTTTNRVPTRPASQCEREREQTQYKLTSNVPRCLSNGDYDALQCNGYPGTSDCYCVDLDGRKIPGTYMSSPNYPLCDTGANIPKCTYNLIQVTRSRSGLLGQPRPRCGPDGLYESYQCQGSSCYCVNKHTGAEIPGTHVQHPEKPRCGDEDKDVERTTKPIRPDVKYPVGGIPYDSDSFDGDVGFQGEVSETIDLDQAGDVSVTSDSDEDDFDKKFGEKVSEGGLDREDEDWSDSSSSSEEDDIGRGGSQDSSHGKKDRVEKASEILTQPGILAGIIGGAVVLLLCLVLLIMFVVYRMRKKDEGSYPLDEPRRGPPNYSYVRAPDKEYYA